jgi:hypothetical protein
MTEFKKSELAEQQLMKTLIPSPIPFLTIKRT